jgi:hypothetical protein
MCGQVKWIGNRQTARLIPDMGGSDYHQGTSQTEVHPPTLQCTEPEHCTGYKPVRKIKSVHIER